MNRRTFLKTLPAFGVLAGTATSFSQDLQPISLPKPEKDGGKSVLAALWERKTNRNISPQKIPMQVLSNLLWAAFGVNRENEPFGGPGRTAASASNSQEIDLYVALPEGVYLYEAVPHRLRPVVAGDFRARSGRRAVATAPVNIFYVVDLAKYSKAPFQEPGLKDSDVVKSYYYVATGLIAGNVYLFAASQGLAAHFHNCDKTNTPREFKLRPEQRVLFAHTVGYPADGQRPR
ncbi:MAG: nitroreductase family protein [Phycisphaerales bacterium]|nr:MAG: nitroreductase family protein [Phycisphaerales bacterium]